MSSTEQTQEKGEEALTDCLCLSVCRKEQAGSQSVLGDSFGVRGTDTIETDRQRRRRRKGALTDWLCLFVCQKEQAGGQSVS